MVIDINTSRYTQKTKSMGLGLVIPLLIMGAVGVAVWAGFWQVDVNVTATSGTSPLTFDEWTVAITNEDELSQTFYFTNPDGIVDLLFEMESNTIVSTDGNCVYEMDKDFEVYLNFNSHDTELINISESVLGTMESGENMITLTIKNISPNRCPLSGSFVISTSYV